MNEKITLEQLLEFIKEPYQVFKHEHTNYMSTYIKVKFTQDITGIYAKNYDHGAEFLDGTTELETIGFYSEVRGMFYVSHVWRCNYFIEDLKQLIADNKVCDLLKITTELVDTAKSIIITEAETLAVQDYDTLLLEDDHKRVESIITGAYRSGKNETMLNDNLKESGYFKSLLVTRNDLFSSFSDMDGAAKRFAIHFMNSFKSDFSGIIKSIVLQKEKERLFFEMMATPNPVLEIERKVRLAVAVSGAKTVKVFVMVDGIEEKLDVDISAFGDHSLTTWHVAAPDRKIAETLSRANMLGYSDIIKIMYRGKSIYEKEIK